LTNLLQVCDDPNPGVALRNCLVSAVGGLESSPSLPDRQAGALLTDYYLRRVGSMDLIADKLRLPRTTFYRRLQRGLTQVSLRLRGEELARL
jgi:transcriptional regulator of acetoin/glycerol metabolism